MSRGIFDARKTPIMLDNDSSPSLLRCVCLRVGATCASACKHYDSCLPFLLLLLEVLRTTTSGSEPYSESSSSSGVFELLPLLFEPGGRPRAFLGVLLRLTLVFLFLPRPLVGIEAERRASSPFSVGVS